MTNVRITSAVMFCMLFALPAMAQDVDADKAREAEKQLLLEKITQLQNENIALKQMVANLQAQMHQMQQMMKIANNAAAARNQGDGVTSKPIAASQPATKPADDNKPLRTVTADELCISVEKLAQEYKRDLSTAKNTIDKDDLYKQFTDKVSNELKGIQLVVEYDVKDVNMTGEGVAEISCGAKYIKFDERKDALIDIGIPLPIKVNMTREQAKNIKKGDKLSVRGKLIATSLSNHDVQLVLSLEVKGKYVKLSYLAIKDVTIKINDRAFTSPYADKP